MSWRMIIEVRRKMMSLMSTWKSVTRKPFEDMALTSDSDDSEETADRKREDLAGLEINLDAFDVFMCT